MPDLTYIDREDVTHVLTSVSRLPVPPGFYECHTAAGARFFLNRTDILLDGVPTTRDREHLLDPQPEEQGA